MKLRLYSIYDAATEAYMNPVYLHTKAHAIREVGAAVNDPNHQFYQNAADLTLFELGEWDDATGRVEMHEANINLGCLLEMKNKAE